MPSLSRPLIRTAIEYDCRGRRVVKHFDDCDAARRFFVAKDRQGKRPRLIIL